MAINQNGSANPAGGTSNWRQTVKGAVAATAIGVGTLAAVVGAHSDPGPTTFDGCSVWGAADAGTDKGKENAHKNRADLPDDDSWVGGADFNTLAAAAAPDAYHQGKVLDDGSIDETDRGAATTIQGYVVDVKLGGVESCNCKAQKDPPDMDTHIFIGPDPQAPKTQCLVVEVTPRIRAMMLQQGIDWSTSKLTNELIGQAVSVSGWLFFDADHTNASVANGPHAHDWRASCWEIHPISDIHLLPAGQAPQLGPEAPAKEGVAPPDQAPKSGPHMGPTKPH